MATLRFLSAYALLCCVACEQDCGLPPDVVAAIERPPRVMIELIYGTPLRDASFGMAVPVRVPSHGYALGGYPNPLAAEVRHLTWRTFGPATTDVPMERGEAARYRIGFPGVEVFVGRHFVVAVTEGGSRFIAESERVSGSIPIGDRLLELGGPIPYPAP